MAWIKDPLFTFAIIGAGIFVLAGWFSEDDISYTVEVREQDLARLNDQWTMQMRRPPNEQELAGLVEQFVKEEIYYREAQRLGLDQNDTIVRRRMVQKLTFITEDIATATQASEEELQAFYEQNLDDYRLPERYSFQHRYFSVDRRDTAKQDATAAVGDVAAKGDPFMLQRQYAGRSQREIGDLFGREFASAIAALEPSDQWQGPIQSAYGWHAVLLSAKQPSKVQALSAVRDKVTTDAQQASRAEANKAYYEDLKTRYSIRYPGDA